DVIHLAAESHVDRSILSPLDFVYTNIIGTVNLLNVAKTKWANNLSNHTFYHVSTDEVYGALGDTGFFTETTSYQP
ncbi:GDP-mannose 4,6-dehydratase, partial [Enterococcus faecalis]|uniref:GDP-mannose 4,6-dehydratase n=1 Tax=Enterococcus faecalis TaxID=1351 RepID=UPI00403F2E6F